MTTLGQQDIALLMVAAIFILGMTTFILGVFILVGRAFGRDITTLASQTNELAKKGLTDEIAGLVGNASALMDSIQQLVRTTAGIGTFLTVTGLLMMGASIYFLIKYIGWPIL